MFSCHSSAALVDLNLFRANLKATKPPYKCPVKDCEKIYRSLSGIQQHFDDHELEFKKRQRQLKSRKKDGYRGGVSYFGGGGTRSGRSAAAADKRRSGEEIADSKCVEVELSGQLVQMDVCKRLKLVSVEKDKKVNGMVVFKPEQPSSISPNHEVPGLTLATSSVLPEARFKILDSYVKRSRQVASSGVEKSEVKDVMMMYDADEEDLLWLELINEERKRQSRDAIPLEFLETAIDLFERSCHFEHRRSDATGHAPTTRDEDAVCSVCCDGECVTTNVILFCDLCNLAVHQECYGVPHIPEGPWVCRRCLLSPSKAVDCCLCPSKIGAMKQTDDGRWAHISCALWIPDAGFANAVFLEPIDSLNRIAAARWKLTCQVCKRRAAGACIQCHKASCYTAFHVTCAQQAGLHMKIRPLAYFSSLDSAKQQGRAPQLAVAAVAAQQLSTTFSLAQSNWRKSAYCDAHTPAVGNNDDDEGSDDGDANGRQGRHGDPDKTLRDDENVSNNNNNRGTDSQPATPSKCSMRHARKLVAEGKEAMPLLSFPALNNKSFIKIKTSLGLEDRDDFVERVRRYWLLKRNSRNGVPLVTHPNSYYLGTTKEEVVVVVNGETGDHRGVNRVDDKKRRNEESNEGDDDDDDEKEEEEEEDGDGKSKKQSLPVLRGGGDTSVGADGLKEELQRMKKLRQELETVRLLNELIKKREKMKLKQIEHKELILKYKLNPVDRLVDCLEAAFKAKGFDNLLDDDNDDDEDCCIANDDDKNGRITGGDGKSEKVERASKRSSSAESKGRKPPMDPSVAEPTKMLSVWKRVKGDGHGTIANFEKDFLSVWMTKWSRRSRISLSRKKKLQNMKALALTTIKKFTGELESVEIKTCDGSVGDDDDDVPDVTKDSINDNNNNDDDDLESPLPRSLPKHLPSVSPSPTVLTLTDSSKKLQSSPLPSVEQTPAPLSRLPAWPAPSPVFARPPSLLDRPLKKRLNSAYRAEVLAVDATSYRLTDTFVGSLHATAAPASSSPSPVDESENLRLLAEAADSISSENSGVADPSFEQNSSNITNDGATTMADRGRPMLVNSINQSLSPVSSAVSQSYDFGRITSQSEELLSSCCEVQSKTIEVCDSTTDWPSNESELKSFNDIHQGHSSKSRPSRVATSSHKRKDEGGRDSVNHHAGDDDDDDDDDGKKMKNKRMKTSVEDEGDDSAAERWSQDGRRKRAIREKSESRDVDELFFVPLNHGDFVWAQCAKYPYYPAIIINPSKPCGNGSTSYGRRSRDVSIADLRDAGSIPVPSADIVRSNSDKNKYLVCFFDSKRTWQWVARSKLDPLGVDSGLDRKKVNDVKRSSSKRSVIEAYKRAVEQRCLRYGENYKRSLTAVLEHH